jgi:hypothetical protein
MNAMHSELMADGGGAMMIGFSVAGVLILLVLLLSIAALTKYLRR